MLEEKKKKVSGRLRKSQLVFSLAGNIGSNRPPNGYYYNHRTADHYEREKAKCLGTGLSWRSWEYIIKGYD